MKSNKVFKIAAIILGVFAVIGIGKGIKWYYWSHLTAEEKASKIYGANGIATGFNNRTKRKNSGAQSWESEGI